MKKTIINPYTSYLLSMLMLAINITGCERCREGGAENSHTIAPSPLQNLKIDYSINLDESKKVKEEGNKVYYEVPLKTQVIIVAEIKAPPTVVMSWEETPLSSSDHMHVALGQSYKHHASSTIHTINNQVVDADNVAKTEARWQFTSAYPISIAVCEKPTYIGQAQNLRDKIIHHQQAFVITWK